MSASAQAETYCAAPPPVVRDIAAQTFYVDRPRSIRSVEVVRRNEASLEALDNGLTAIIAGADVALGRNSPTAGRCSASWLAIWAAEGAMLGRMDSRQAEYERKWRTAGIAIAYMKLKPFAESDERAVIEGWLRALARRVTTADATHDNHAYWAGLVETAVGVAAADPDLLAEGRLRFDAAMADIRPDGSLRAEMARAGRALHYHNYALAPLVMMAELAALHGEDWYARGDGALHRLADLTVAGLGDPAAFSRRAGAPVELPRDGITGWMTFYAKRFPERMRDFNPTTRYNYYWLGGDMAETARVLGRGTS